MLASKEHNISIKEGGSIHELLSLVLLTPAILIVHMVTAVLRDRMSIF